MVDPTYFASLIGLYIVFFMMLLVTMYSDPGFVAKNYINDVLLDLVLKAKAPICLKCKVVSPDHPAPALKTLRRLQQMRQDL